MTPDFTLKQISDGEYICPAPECTNSYPTQKGVSAHHADAHPQYIAVDVVGDAEWYEFLREEYRGRGRTARDIAAELPPYIGKDTLIDELHRLDLIYPPDNSLPLTGVARFLAPRHVRTIEDARKEAQRQREGRS